MIKRLYLLPIFSAISLSGTVGGSIEISSTLIPKFEYNTKATFETNDSTNSKYIYNPRYTYSKYTTEFRALKIKGDLHFANTGIYVGFDIESPYYVHDIHKFSDSEKKNKKNKKDKDNGVTRLSLNPNKTIKPKFNINIGYNRLFNNVEYGFNAKYALSTFKGLERLDQNILTLSQNVNIYNKFANLFTNIEYKVKDIFDPIELKGSIAAYKDVEGFDVNAKIELKHNFSTDYTKNKIAEFLENTTLTVHEHEGNIPFPVEKMINSHERRTNSTNFGENVKTFNLNSNFEISLGRRINKNLNIEVKNKLDLENLKVNATTTNDHSYFSKVLIVKNETSIFSRFTKDHLTVLPEISFSYERSFSDNNYTDKYKHDGFDYIHVLDEHKNNYEKINFKLKSKVLYNFDISDKLSITPRMYFEYSSQGKRHIYSKEYIESLEKENEELKELIDDDDDELSKQLAENLDKINNKPRFALNHSLIIQPGVYISYKQISNLELFTSIDIPFEFKTSVIKEGLGIIKKEFKKDEYTKKKNVNKIMPSEIGLKAEVGIRYSW